MNKEQRGSKVLKGVLKDRTDQRGLDREQHFVSPWEHDNLSISWP